MVCAHGECSVSAVNARLGRVSQMLLLVGQDVFHPVNDTATDFKEERPPSNDAPTLQSPLGEVSAVSELLLIDVVTGEFWMVHGFAPLRCYQVNSEVDGYLVLESFG